ncbi:hypothetical protein QJQ45_007194 [Haematococcus lacustris]|nr:hypothetical protein QJQ45_007194 [Haematococcus lacustris]
MAQDASPDFFGATFAIEDEDHTLANTLRFFLNKKPAPPSHAHAGSEDPSNRALLAKLQELGKINLMAIVYGIDAKSSELRATDLDKEHVEDLKEEAAKHRPQAASFPAGHPAPALPRGAGQRRGRVVLVDEHRTTRVSSALNGQQPCEEEVNQKLPTRPAGWKPPAGQLDLRLLRPAWSQQRDLPVRGTLWCPVVAPRKPPQPPRSSQAATQPAASKPGPRTPLPAKRTKRTTAEQAAEPRIGKSRWRPLCWWPDQTALSAKGKEYPELGYKRLRDKPPKAQQQQQQPAGAQ